MNIQNEQRPHISYSQLATYLTCPLQYKFNYVDGRPWKYTPAPIVFGKAIHEAVAVYNRSLMAGSPLTLDDAVESFSTVWGSSIERENIDWGKPDDPVTLLKKGEALIRLYHGEYSDARPVEVELPWRLPLIDPLLGKLIPSRDGVGVIDAIFNGDSHRLVEIKTSSRNLSTNDVETNLQLSLYSYAHYMLYGTIEEAINVIVLVKTQEPKIQVLETKREPADYTRLIRLMESVIQCIDDARFYPSPSQFACGGCQYRTECKGW